MKSPTPKKVRPGAHIYTSRIKSEQSMERFNNDPAINFIGKQE